MNNQKKKLVFAKHWFFKKRNLLKKLPKLLDNSKLAKRRAKPDPIESCINQSDNPETCLKLLRRKKK